MKHYRFIYVRQIVLALGLCASGVPCVAQPAMSRGQQALPINYAECLNRAGQALRNVGFTATGAGNFAQGFKEASGAYIICNDAPGGGMVVNIVVATNTNDAGVPGKLRQCLQAQMERPGMASPCTGGCSAPDFFNTTFDWIDNGHKLGTIKFNRDGSTEVRGWTNDRHFWTTDRGDLMISSTDSRPFTVVRLTWNQNTCSYKGERDKTSQRQDGVKTEIKPPNR